MSSGTVAARSEDGIEMHHLLNPSDDLEQDNRAGGQVLPVKSGVKKPEGILQRLMLRIDEHTNVKILMRVWGPRLEFVVRLMIVATFLDDSIRTATHFPEHTQQVGELGFLKWLAAASPKIDIVIATVALGIGLIAQSVGSLCLLALIQPDVATKALIGWAIAQPVLYAQFSNLEFVTESLSLIGGLLMLRAHLVSEPLMQLLGRLLLPAMYLYYAGHSLYSALTLDETNSLAMFVSSLSMFAVIIAVIIGIVISATLMFVGLKSRVVAFLLALANLGYVCYQHPFFRMIWIEDGEWKYDEDNMSMPNVALAKDISVPADIPLRDFDLIYDMQKYYFFLGLSTSGALLLLAQFGPGEIAVQKDETLLPVVARAQD